MSYQWIKVLMIFTEQVIKNKFVETVSFQIYQSVDC